MNRVRLGGIGCGYWGPNVIRNLIEIPSAEFVAVADLQRSRLDHMQERYPQITTTENYRDLFALGLDAVTISTPPHTHFAIARDCLLHGLDVLVEKPFTSSSRDAQELIEIAEREGRVLMVGHTFKYNPAIRMLRKMIHDGELGDIYYIDAVRASLGLFHSNMNVIWDLAPHDISIVLYLLDALPASISARGKACVQRDVEDVAYMGMLFPNDLMTSIRMSWLDPCKTRRITVVGSEKMVICDDVENHDKIKIYDKRVRAIRHTETFGEFHFAYHYGDVVVPYIRYDEPLRLECLHFIECIQERKTPLTDGYDGLQVVQIIEAAQQSLKNDGISVPVQLAEPLRPLLDLAVGTPPIGLTASNGAAV